MKLIETGYDLAVMIADTKKLSGGWDSLVLARIITAFRFPIPLWITAFLPGTVQISPWDGSDKSYLKIAILFIVFL